MKKELRLQVHFRSNQTRIDKSRFASVSKRAQRKILEVSRICCSNLLLNSMGNNGNY